MIYLNMFKKMTKIMSVEFFKLLFTYCIKSNVALILVFVTVRENFEN